MLFSRKRTTILSNKVNSELVINVNSKEVSLAVLEDQKLVELHREKRNVSFSVGDIYLGRVRKVMPGLNAAFVDVGYKKDAFLHYFDLGMTFGATTNLLEAATKQKTIPPLNKIKPGKEMPKEGKIEDVLSADQKILVQIAKEPISTKGPRLNAELSLAGRCMVLVPFGDKVSVSQKIKNSEERARLKQLILSIKPIGFSIIIRTSAQGKKASELDEELHRLVHRWEKNIKRIIRAKAPSLIYEESNRALNILRDTFNPSFTKISVNDADFYNEIKEYVAQIAPGCEDIVQLYENEKPIFDHYGITRQIKSLFGRTVTYKSGAYLIIEQTEAMYVVDVNSGNRSKKSTEQEATAFDVNMAAAEELVRQLRLRDMGGIIVVDFIDMNDPKHRQALFEHMVKLMQGDRARHNILPLSKFGVMQITRQRVRPAMDVNTEETCPTCMGSGKMKSSILFTDQIEKKIAFMVQEHGIKQFLLHLHPYVAAYVKKGILNTSIFSKWKRKYSKGIKIIEDQDIAFLDYRFYDLEHNELDFLDSND